MRAELDPDLPVLLIPLIALVAAAAYIWRRWRGRWRVAAVLPIASVAVNVWVIRPSWGGGREWSGYDAIFRYAPFLAVEFFAIGIVGLVHAAVRARESDRSDGAEPPRHGSLD